MERLLADMLPNHIATGQDDAKDAHFGLDKVTMDFAFFAIAFNIKKICAKIGKGASNGFNNTKNGQKTACYRKISYQNQIEKAIDQKWAA